MTAKEFDNLWIVLAGKDAGKAHTAIWTLSVNAEQAVPFLKARLHPVAPMDPKRLARLMSELDSENFATRQQATQELERLAEQAAPTLRQALNGKATVELRRRVEGLLVNISTQMPSSEQLRQLRSIEILEHIATTGSRQVLQALSAGRRRLV